MTMEIATTILRWRDASGRGLEHAVFEDRGAGGVSFDSVVIGSPEDGTAIAYSIRCDRSWRVREASVLLVGTPEPLLLRSDGNGHWWGGEGTPLDALDGCVDIDIVATPLTNTLPIRRLRLRESQSETIRVAYIDLPSLTVRPEEQRYTRLGPRTYRFEALGSDFVRDIEVDEQGLILDYPGLFTRES